MPEQLPYISEHTTFLFAELDAHNYRKGRVLRIALVTETYPPEVNGAAMTLQRLTEGLVRRGRELQVIRPRQGRDDGPQSWQRLGSEARRTTLSITWSRVVDEFDDHLEKLAASAGDGDLTTTT